MFVPVVTHGSWATASPELGIQSTIGALGAPTKRNANATATGTFVKCLSNFFMVNPPKVGSKAARHPNGAGPCLTNQG